HEKAKDLYARLRQNSKEQTYHDSTDMQRVVVQCFTKYQQLTKGLAPNLSQIMQFRLEVMSVKPQIEAMIMELKSAISQLLSAQQKRQNDIWTLVRVAGLKMQTPPHQGHPRAELTPGLKNSPFSTVSPLRTPAPSLPGSSMVLSSLMAENDNEASMLALSENAETRNRFSSELNSLKSESDNALKQTKTMDWTFLEGQDHKI
uniref:Inhibitor of nuclear factor kappa-B kinase subunit alpha-like n=1 Tax=Saccoglossus kowalevskii TaxID=10224 RepID=A0ABM0M200_SACKO